MNARAPRLIVALDVSERSRAQLLISELAPLGVLFKVGYQPLYAIGDALFPILERAGAHAFIDAKLHDIPRTVAEGVRALVRPGVALLNVHALGGTAMLQAAAGAAGERAAELGIPAPKVLAVTVLTSMDAAAMHEVGLDGPLTQRVVQLAQLAVRAGCDGVVCGVGEVTAVKAAAGEGCLALTPGIRPPATAAGDQKRIATPAEAVSAGADFLVVGRPIIEASDPAQAARAVLTEMQHA